MKRKFRAIKLSEKIMNREQNIETSFNEEFCASLEYRICSELKEADSSDLKGFWCDGISWLNDDKQLSKKLINDKRRIETIAWIGKSGQEKYKAIIHFGRKALSRYAKGTDLTDSIPELESQHEWIEIDIENKTIEIKLK